MKSSDRHDIRRELAALDAKINDLLPPRYQHCYADVSPTSMGSAGLKYDDDGSVAWDMIWTSFCDLALAGGPPHRGKLLEPAAESEIAAEKDRYDAVAAEIVRAVRLTTALPVVSGGPLGWVGFRCESAQEAGWLQLAVTAENVSARRRGTTLYLPAGPSFRVEKEIKNVVVALTKAFHYWEGHLSDTQQALAGEDVWEAATPTEAAADPSAYEAAIELMRNGLVAAGLPMKPQVYTGWVGVQVPSEEEAVWLLRAVLVERVLARREEDVLYFPVGAAPDAGLAERAGRAFARAWALSAASSMHRSAW